MAVDRLQQHVFIAPLFNESVLGHNSTKHACLPVWDSEDAEFSDCALPYISAIPLTLVAVIFVLGSLGRISDRWRPQWTRRFIVEDPPAASEVPEDDKGRSLGWIGALLLFTILGLSASIVQLVLSPRDLSTVFLLTAWALVALIVGIARPATSPGYLLLFYFAAFGVEFLNVLGSGLPLRVSEITHYVAFLSALASIGVILVMRLRDPALLIADISAVGDAPDDRYRSPEDNLRLWQFLSISWMLPMIRLGKKRTLNEEDVWKLGYEFQHARLFEKFSALTGTVVRRLLQANGLDICFLSISATTETVCDYMGPVLLQQLLISMENPLSPKRVALTYALLIMGLRLISAQSEVFNTWFGRRCYERCRGEMILMVYEKALSRKNVIGIDPELKLKTDQNGNSPSEANGYAKKPQKIWTRVVNTFKFRALTTAKVADESKTPASMGKILNVVRGDVYEVAQRFWEIENMIETGLGLILSIVLVWLLLGPSCFIGVLTVIFGQIINAILTRIQLRVIKRGRGATDGRLQVTSQYIEAIRHLRWYGWHTRWIKEIHEAREHELRLRVQRMTLSTIMNFMNALTNGLFPVAALYGYTVLGGHTLSIDIIFPALALFNRMSSCLRDIPQIIQQLANAYISMCRIEDFMKEPDREEPEIDTTSSGSSIELKGCDFAWADMKDPVLSKVNLKFDEGFHVVYGQVGAGKSALLQSLLGELDKLAGTSHIPQEMIGYCAQTPWLQSMTIRDNILFSAPYEEWRYKNVLDACELLPDLAEFEHGDLSAIGENGIGLSGGQKARVALARAVYSRARILLLDDPISALDFNTAENIVSKCFDGPLMKDRIIVLVTHRTDLVRHLASQFIEINDGKATGSSNEASLSDAANSNANGDKAKADTIPNSKGVKKQDDNVKPNKFEDEEHRSEWGVQAKVYWKYIKSGKLKWWALSAIFVCLWRLSGVGTIWFLKAWGEAYNQIAQTYLLFGADSAMYPARYMPSSGVSTSFFDPFKNFPSPEDDVKPWLWVYLGITTWIAIASWLAQIFLVVLTYVSAKTLFSQAIVRVSEANFRFYDVTPVGRLMNRLTSDIGTIDSNISQQFHIIIFQGVNWISSMIVIGSITPIFMAFSVSFVIFSVWIFMQFLPTSQSLRRLETVSLSPLFANFGELLHGLTTVRAFHSQHRFLDRIVTVVDKFQGMDHFYWTLQNWLAFRLQNMSAIAVFFLTVLALYTNTSPGLTAWVLSAAGNFVRSTHVLCRRFGALQMDFVSMERIDELLGLEVEPSGTLEPPASWPKYGSDLVMENVTVRYAPHLDAALNNISLRIPGGSTTAILGRTGSGKSTLAVTLLNVTRPESGKITIDNLDIKDITNHALRTRITFVAQDPVLFPGSIRLNLDPLDAHTDTECDEVLQRVCRRHNWTLSTAIEAGGRNLSQGQRQLIGLTRAILRRSPIVILDEATASIDYESSMEIQRILREELVEATVVTIAHRLQAVRDADWAIVLDKGRVVRQGPASEMLKAEGARMEEVVE